jgi:hypothetical protein
MDAEVMPRFDAACILPCEEAAPICGDSAQAGSAAPASDTANPDDAPHSRSLRDTRPEKGELESRFIGIALPDYSSQKNSRASRGIL